MPLTSSMEDYLEAVLVLQQQKGYVRCVDVAELLDVKKPSVSRAVKELSKKKCLIKKDDGTLSLTEQGQQIAQQIYEKHQFFTKRLVEAGVPQDIAAQDPFQHSAAFPIHSYSIIHLRIFLFQICSEQNSSNIYKQNHKYQIKRKIFSYQISQYCYK